MIELDLDHRTAWCSAAVAAAAVALSLLAACVDNPSRPTAAAPVPAFYPLPPDPPRIQHLATFASARDIRATTGGLADFVLGAEGVENRLLRPYGATMFDGKLFVADSRAPGLAIFDLAGNRFNVVEGAGAGRMQRPVNVAVDADGTRFVTDAAREQVLVFDRNDRFTAAFGARGDFKPVDAIVRGDRLYVTDLTHHEVQVLDKRSGQLLFRIGTRGNDDGALYQPTNLALSPEGDIYVVETGNFRVSRFTQDGKYVSRFGELGQGPGQFARPKGIAVDRAGRVYVGDAAFQNVQIFDAQGRVLMSFGQQAGSFPGLNLPAGVAIDYDNVALFRRYAVPGFEVEYVIFVVSQFGPDQVDAFGFGRMKGVAYPPDPTDPPKAKPGG